MMFTLTLSHCIGMLRYPSSIEYIQAMTLFQVWLEETSNDRILSHWKELKLEEMNLCVRGLFIKDVVNGVILRDGVSGSHPEKEWILHKNDSNVTANVLRSRASSSRGHMVSARSYGF